MSPEPFVKRALSVQINVPAGIQKMNYQTGKLETSAFAGQRISLTKYRIKAAIECYGEASAVAATFQIYDLPYELMAALSGYGTQGVFNYAAKSAQAISSGSGVVTVSLFVSENTNDTLGKTATQEQLQKNQKTCVFRGSLVTASAQMSAAPDPFLFIQCNTLNDARLVPTPPISFKGSVRASVIARQLADFMGWGFEDAGVQTVLQNPYFCGSVSAQLSDLAQQGSFVWIVENNTLSIWPVNGARKAPTSNASGILINDSNGLIEYPEFNGVGISFSTIYNPGLRFGDQVRLETIFPNATGTYLIYGLAHHLDSQDPSGEWTSIVQGSFIHAKIGQAMEWTPDVS